jgi:hypothetical protein
MNTTNSYALDNYDNEMMVVTDFMATIALFTWTIGCLLCMTATDHQFGQPPPVPEPQPQQSSNWDCSGIYHLNRPQTLTKAERAALDIVGGNAAFLYERTHKSGAKSWRYAIGDTWFYPSERNVRRRGLDLFGNNRFDIE